MATAAAGVVPRAPRIWMAAMSILATKREASEDPWLYRVCVEEKLEIFSSTYWPPKSCIPKRAKTTMNRKRRNRRLMMDFIELRRETTRFLRDAQYLPTEPGEGTVSSCPPPSPPTVRMPRDPKDLLCDFKNTQ
jgi:hypothetical protein